MFWRAVLSGIAREPKLVAGFAARRDEALAVYLAENLPETTRRLLAARVLSQDATRVEFVRDGTRWTVDLGDEIAEHLFTYGGYETDAIEALCKIIPKGTVVDLGANVGTTTIPFAQAGYPVIAVEPIPATFAMLRRNLEQNGLTGSVKAMQCAIAETEGPITMDPGYASGQGEIADDGPVVVDGCPLSAIAQRDVALVWADVQGSETAVIRTGSSLWAQGTPLYLEIDPARLQRHGGVDQFLEAASEHFTAYQPRNELGTTDPHPIGEFASFVESIDGYTDALLIV